MKKYILFLFCVLSIGGCEKFLDENPKSILTPENAYTTESDWNQTLSSAYAMLQEVFVGKYTITLSEFGTDEVEPFDLGWAAYAELKYYTFSSSHAFFSVHYSDCYEGIKRCNAVLDMPGGVVSSSTRDLMQAQAKFLRAIYYFDLVRMYGGVPLWLKSSIDKNDIMKPRASADDVYDAITKDLKEAENILPATWSNAADKGRATKYATEAMLARVYLQWGKPQDALNYCNLLDGKFHLYANLSDIFNNQNKNAEYENIFEVQFKHSGSWGLEGSIQHSYWGPRGVGGPTNFGGWGGFGPTQYVYDSYAGNDKRKQAFFLTEFNGVRQSPPCCYKYWDPVYGNVIEDDNLNFILIRYADVLLMKAEALNDLNDNSQSKYDAINAIRNRAGLASLNISDNLTKAQFGDSVLQERLHELCCEHMRRWDLLRAGKLSDYLKNHVGINIQSYQTLYPIPQDAIDANDKLTQNPGY
jgi:hypothetical protein